MDNLKYKPDFERAKLYWKAFWEKEVIDRPLICINTVKKGMTFPRYDSSVSNAFRKIMNGDFESLLKAFEEYISALAFCGESIPSFDISLGPDQYAAFLGASITAGEEDITTWVNPIINDWGNFGAVIDQTPNSYFDRMKQCYAYAVDYSKDKFLLNMMDLHSGMDALSALRGPQDLCFDIMDYPEEIHRVLDDVRKTYRDVFMMGYENGAMDTRGSIGWAPTFCEGKFAVTECDFSCMLSPEQAREFVIPAIAEEAAFLDHTVYHYDGKEALGHLDDILAIPDIDVIQWVPGDGNPPSIEWMDLLHKIQAAGKGLWLYDWMPDQIRARFKELKPEGLVFQTYAETEDEAEKLIEDIKKAM